MVEFRIIAIILGLISIGFLFAVWETVMYYNVGTKDKPFKPYWLSQDAYYNAKYRFIEEHSWAKTPLGRWFVMGFLVIFLDGGHFSKSLILVYIGLIIYSLTGFAWWPVLSWLIISASFSIFFNKVFAKRK